MLLWILANIDIWCAIGGFVCCFIGSIVARRMDILNYYRVWLQLMPHCVRWGIRHKSYQILLHQLPLWRSRLTDGVADVDRKPLQIQNCVLTQLALYKNKFSLTALTPGQPGWAETTSVENTHHPLSLLSSSLWDCLCLTSFLIFIVRQYADCAILI